MTKTLNANGNTYTDDSNPTTGLGNGGWRTRLLPMLGDVMTDVGGKLASIIGIQSDISARQTDVTNRQSDVVTRQNDVIARQSDVASMQTNVQGLKDSTQTLRDSAAASAVLSQQWVGAANNVLIPAINYRLASAWDANGNPTAYALTGVVGMIIDDTRKHSDGGRWRTGRLARASSYYNETLNTAIRGSKKEYPVVALIVPLNTGRWIVYDKNDLDANGSPRMWRVMARGGTYQGWGNLTAAKALNGWVVVSSDTGQYGETYVYDFVKDDHWYYDTSGRITLANNRRITESSTSASGITAIASQAIASNRCTSVDLRVLPGAPLDPMSRLPIPTIAAATVAGTSVIHPTGLVVNLTASGGHRWVRFISDNLLSVNRLDDGRAIEQGPIPYTSMASSSWRTHFYGGTTSGGALRWCASDYNAAIARVPGAIGGNTAGLSLLAEDQGTPANGMVSYVTNSYATGWLPGDTRLCAITEGAGSNGASGGELIANGDFSAGTANWSSLPGGEVATLSVVSGALRVTPTGAWGGASQTISTVVGQQYTVFFDIVAVTGIQATIRVRDVGGDVLSVPPDGPGTGRRSCTFVARQTATVVLLFANGGSADFDNVSCRKTGTFSDVVTGTGELIVNGDGSTTAGWSTANGGTIASVSGELQLTRGANDYAPLSQTIKTVPGETYFLQATARKGTAAGGVSIRAVDWSAGETVLNSAAVSGTTGAPYQFCFVAKSANTDVMLRIDTGSAAGQTAFWKSISVKLCIPDRSYKGKGLIVNGTLTRAPVASGSDLQAVSGFNANNYVEQPYSSDMDFGTGDFFFMLRLTHPLSAPSFDRIFDRGTPGMASGAAIRALISSGAPTLFISDGTNTATLTAAAISLSAANYTNLLFMKRGATLEIWANDVLIGSQSAASVGSLSNLSAVFRLGYGLSGAAGWGGSATMFRYGAYAPTPNQIRKMYADEAPLFQPGAKAFLGGTSSSVQSLALDEDTGVLHVGTADGVDQFAGLRRVGRVAANTQGIGSELVGNGTFDTDISGWTQVSGTVTWSNGALRGTSSGTASGRGARAITCTIGKSYVLTGDVKSVTSGLAAAYISPSTATGAAVASNDTLVQGGKIGVPFTATATTMYVLLQPASNTNGVYAEFDNISVKEIGALSATSVTSVAAGGGTVLVGTANEAGIVSDLMPIKDELRQPAQAANSNDIVFDGVTADNVQTALGRIFVAEGESVLVDALIEATEYGLTPVEGASFRLTARLRRNYGGNVAIVGNVLALTVDRTTSTIDANLTVDTTSQSFAIAVTGKTGTRLVWRASTRLVWLGETRTAA